MYQKPAGGDGPEEGPIDFLEKERLLIAYELQENVHKTLALLRLYIRLLKPEAEDELEIKSRSLEELDLVMTEIRCLSRELAAPKIPLKGMVESLRDLIAFIRISKGIAIGFDHDLEHYPISAGKKLALFRIVQAQLENILELPLRAGANIILTLQDQHVQLIIQDHGAVSAGDAADSGRTARIEQRISYIRERIRIYQGTFGLEIGKDGGRRLVVTI